MTFIRRAAALHLFVLLVSIMCCNAAHTVEKKPKKHLCPVDTPAPAPSPDDVPPPPQPSIALPPSLPPSISLPPSSPPPQVVILLPPSSPTPAPSYNSPSTSPAESLGPPSPSPTYFPSPPSSSPTYSPLLPPSLSPVPVPSYSSPSPSPTEFPWPSSSSPIYFPWPPSSSPTNSPLSPIPAPSYNSPPLSPIESPLQPPSSQSPSPPPLHIGSAIEGVVYCQSCRLPGYVPSLNASPLRGLSVKLACYNINKHGISINGNATTDSKGYFLIQVQNKKPHQLKTCRIAFRFPSWCNKAVHPRVSRVGYRFTFDRIVKAGSSHVALYGTGSLALAPTSTKMCPHRP